MRATPSTALPGGAAQERPRADGHLQLLLQAVQLQSIALAGLLAAELLLPQGVQGALQLPLHPLHLHLHHSATAPHAHPASCAFTHASSASVPL